MPPLAQRRVREALTKTLREMRPLPPESRERLRLEGYEDALQDIHDILRGAKPIRRSHLWDEPSKGGR